MISVEISVLAVRARAAGFDLMSARVFGSIVWWSERTAGVVEVFCSFSWNSCCFLGHSKESNHNESASSPPKVKTQPAPTTDDAFVVVFVVKTTPGVVLHLPIWLASCSCMPAWIF